MCVSNRQYFWLLDKLLQLVNCSYVIAPQSNYFSTCKTMEFMLGCISSNISLYAGGFAFVDSSAVTYANTEPLSVHF